MDGKKKTHKFYSTTRKDPSQIYWYAVLLLIVWKMEQNAPIKSAHYNAKIYKYTDRQD